MSTPEQSGLGKPTAYIDQYAPELLFPVERAPQRRLIGLESSGLPFFGADIWTAYELGWLNMRGKPQIAIARLVVPCESSHIIESKSLKLYLNSFTNTRFENLQAIQNCLRQDLSKAIWHGSPIQGSVGVQLIQPDVFERESIASFDGLSLDRLDVECSLYQPAPELLSANFEEAPVTETLTSDLLKSNCLVTGQPDWGSLKIDYSGPQINQEGLLQYIVSFRNHNEFHEHCVERIYLDIMNRCKPTQLTVYARYTRRGGLDINPIRANHPQPMPVQQRTARQ